MAPRAHGSFSEGEASPFRDVQRTVDFWARATTIYGSYKVTQLKALGLRLQGKSPEEIKQILWIPQHTWAGSRMYELAVTLRGFYLKAGQFIGARADFIPEQICEKLSLLQDRVPPMPPAQAQRMIEKELGLSDLGEVFEWIDLEDPLGSASISQVHKAQLRHFSSSQLKRMARQEKGLIAYHTVKPGETAWSICNDAGISLSELTAKNKGLELEELQPGQVVKLPVVLGLHHYSLQSGNPIFGSSSTGSSSISSSGDTEWDASDASGTRSPAAAAGQVSGSGGRGAVFPLARFFNDSSSGGDGSSNGSSSNSSSSSQEIDPNQPLGPAAAAIAHAIASGNAPKDGLVAVKIQYPDALSMMSSDLVNLRSLSAFLSKTEIKFDLVSAVDELQKQIHLEFDFMREARVMDTIAEHLSSWRGRVAVPRSVPGLVTQRCMVMTYMDGLPLMQLKDEVAHLPKWQRDKAARRILSQLSEAYGRMILGEGLFQADGHPGNILVQKKGGIALLDYGQSKQLPYEERVAFAKLVIALDSGRTKDIDEALTGLGVRTSKPDVALRREMAYGMFDTFGTVNPFDKNSPIKQTAIEYFPPDMFFVLRVVQLLRGLSNGMGITDFSTARQWAPLAEDAVKLDKWKQRQKQKRQKSNYSPQTLADLAVPLKLAV